MQEDHYRVAWEQLINDNDGPFYVTDTEVGGHPLKTYAKAPNSLRQIWMMAASAYGAQDYLVYGDERWTYSRAGQEIAAIAHWMQQQGIGTGDRVALAMRNYPEWVLAYWAGVSIGVSVVGMNAWWVTDEMHYALQDSAPKAIFCDSERLQRLLPVAHEFPDIKIVGVRHSKGFAGAQEYYDWQDLSTGEAGMELPPVEVATDSDACIFYTSGTTGRPKGARLTHRGCVLNLMNISFMRAVIELAAKQQGQTAATQGIPQKVSALLTSPLFHVTANNCSLHPVTAMGGKMVHMHKWDALDALKLIEAEQITIFSGVPAMSRELIQHPDFDQYQTQTLIQVTGGGSAVQPDLVERINQVFGASVARTGYGMTETCGIISSVAGQMYADYPTSVGRAVPTLDVRCIAASGQPVAQGETGEICVRGGNVIAGYLNQTEATADAIQDAWLRTGDIGRVDENGFIFIEDRIKDMIIRGGENIYCAEVEGVIYQLEAVAECAVFAVQDTRLGEKVAAAVYFADGQQLTAEAIRAHCAKLLARYKVPEYLFIRTQPIARNATGKFLKRQLQHQVDLAQAV
ncbi:MAG: class I adenylate-forming enzyme family protein [Gammaproteobacteria bacterium]